MILPYALLICFIVVIGAILLYCRHLQRMKVVPSLKNVPSMSYFMTAPDEMEQGLLTQKFSFKWNSISKHMRVPHDAKVFIYFWVQSPILLCPCMVSLLIILFCARLWLLFIPKISCTFFSYIHVTTCVRLINFIYIHFASFFSPRLCTKHVYQYMW